MEETYDPKGGGGFTNGHGCSPGTTAALFVGGGQRFCASTEVLS